MSDLAEYIELELVPDPPDTVSSTKGKVRSMIEDILVESGNGDLIANGQIDIKVEKTFPSDEAIIVGKTFISQVGVEVIKLILPELKKKFKKVEKRKKSKKKKK